MGKRSKSARAAARLDASSSSAAASPASAPVTALPASRKRKSNNDDDDQPLEIDSNGEGNGGDMANADVSRSAKKKRSKKENKVDEGASLVGLKNAAAAMYEDSTSSSPSKGDAASELAGLSSDRIRKLKGKGKMIEDPVENAALEDEAETVQLRKEMVFKDSIIASQTALLASLRSSVACTVCLETLDRPFSLSCGHIFCRRCLLNWFHRSDPHGDPEPAPEFDHFSDGEAHTDNFIYDDSSTDRSAGSDDEHTAPLPTHPSRRAAASTAIAGARKKTITELAEEESESSEEEDTSAIRSRRSGDVMGGTFGSKSFNVRAGAGAGKSDEVWKAMEDGMDQVIETSRFFATNGDNARASGSGIRSRTRVAAPNGSSSTRSETATQGGMSMSEKALDTLRNARLAMFGNADDRPAAAPSTSTSASIPALPSAAASASETIILDSDHPSSDSDSDSDSDDDDPPHSPPVGQHRLDNLICPQCRDIVIRAPFRVFLISDIVTLIRAAESNGLLATSGTSEPDAKASSASASAGSASKSTKKGGKKQSSEKRSDRRKGTTGKARKEKVQPGMDEADLSWAGLFSRAGIETNEQKKSRTAGLMRDDDDGGVYRCGNCNWEVDGDGLCGGCGVIWNLEGSDAGEGIDLDDSDNASGSDDRSVDSGEDEDGDANDFIDDSHQSHSPPPYRHTLDNDDIDGRIDGLHARGSGFDVDDEDDAQQTGSDEEAEVLASRRAKKKIPTMSISSDDEEEVDAEEAAEEAAALRPVVRSRPRRVIAASSSDNEDSDVIVEAPSRRRAPVPEVMAPSPPSGSDSDSDSSDED